MEWLIALSIVTAACCILFTGTWLAALKIGKWAIVDPIWVFSVSINVIVFLFVFPVEIGLRSLLIVCLVSLYSLRLGGHLLQRFLKHEGDDPRYVSFAEDWGENAKPRMLLFFIFQALGSVALCVSIFVTLTPNLDSPTAWDYIGFAVILLSLGGEAIADAQLSRFLRERSDKQEVCKVGLWRYSRHPNYFFQWLFWVGLIPLAVSSNIWWLSFVSPALMYHFLNNVTGIPPSEKSSLKSKGDRYRQYQRETSAFFPLPPNKHV